MRTLTAFYDLAVTPVSFDAVPFLIRARMAAQDAQCEALHVAIVPQRDGQCGRYRDKSAFFDCAELDFRLWNIVVPACQLAGATVSVTTGWRQAGGLIGGDEVWPHAFDRQTLADRPYWIGPIVDGARAGRTIPCLRASDHARRSVAALYTSFGRPVVTLTRRAARHQPEGNSDPAAWMDLAREVEQMGYAPLQVYDTAQCLEAGSGYGELNLDLRMACYELAALNVHEAGGAAQLSWYSTVPYLQFAREDDLRFYALNGVGHDQRLPWGYGAFLPAGDMAAMITSVRAVLKAL